MSKAVLTVLERVEEPGHLVSAEDDGELLGSWADDPGDSPFLPR
jgi:hypothetical protein